MELALSLARRALGSVSPNPAVGAVVAKDGEVLGEGWTQPPGETHAEVVALAQAGQRAAGATLYTTLEPCNHHGRTRPCTQAIIDAGIAEVHSAMADPNPNVPGGGQSRLQEAGLKTVAGEREQEARKVVEAYLKFVTTGLPFVTAKFAMSLDGKIATRTGDSRWITGPEARRYAHVLRATHDAIMVGINTVLADDPRLTARHDEGTALSEQPLRIVVDSRGRTPDDARLLDEPGQTIVAVARADSSKRSRLLDRGVDVEELPAEDGLVDLSALLGRLGRREITSVLVEGGGALLGSLFDLRLVDKVVAFVAPAIVGGSGAPAPVAGAGVERIAEAVRLSRVETQQLGPDLAIIGYCQYAKSSSPSARGMR